MIHDTYLFGVSSNRKTPWTPADIAAVFKQAAAASSKIRELPSAEIIAVLDAAGKLFTKGGRYYKKAFDHLCQTVPFSKEAIEATLAIIPTILAKAELEKRLRLELGLEGMTVRPVYGQDFLALAQKRDELATIEKKEEKAVLSAISKKIAEAADEISGYINAVTAADVLLAKAEMTRMLALSRPRMRDEDAAIEIANGRLPAVEEAALKRKLKYQPLNCALNEKVILIHGSNMLTSNRHYSLSEIRQAIL